MKDEDYTYESTTGRTVASYWSSGDTAQWDGSGTWQSSTGGTVTITDSTGQASTQNYASVDFDTEFTPPDLNCLVCDDLQSKMVCELCAVAVKEYRNEAFLKQIAELL